MDYFLVFELSCQMSSCATGQADEPTGVGEPVNTEQL